jgi:hypothetical protein
MNLDSLEGCIVKICTLEKGSRGVFDLVFCLSLAPLIAIGIAYCHRPSQNPVQENLFAGVQYTRRFRSSPRPQVIYLVTLDLAAPGLNPFVTPP